MDNARQIKLDGHNAAIRELMGAQNPDGSSNIETLAMMEYKALVTLSIILLNKAIMYSKGDNRMIASFAYTEAKNIGEFMEMSLSNGVKSHLNGGTAGLGQYVQQEHVQ